jgi:hypothetical protein
MDETVCGYPVKRQTTDGETVVLVSIDGQDYVLEEAEFEEVVNSSNDDPGTFREGILEYVKDSAAEWDAERGPDSTLGRNVEQGTPSTDHSSEPQAE